MLWIRNLKINNKLLIMILVPMLGMLYFSAANVYDKAINMNNMNRLETLANLEVSANAAVHELQKERGLVSGYYGKKTTQNQSIMFDQRKETNRVIDHLEQSLKLIAPHTLGDNPQKDLSEAMLNLNKLKEQRSLIDANQIDYLLLVI